MYTVYKITNNINGKCYVGITSRSVKERFEEHMSRARNTTRHSRLYAAMRKYGVCNFDAVAIDSADNEDSIRILETQYINKCDSYKNGYNSNLGGHGFLHFPEHIREKMSVAHTGKKMSAESRRKMSAAKLGNSSCATHFKEYLGKGKNNPKSKCYLIQFPDGHIEMVRGLREFCRNNNLTLCKLTTAGVTKNYMLLGRFNDYPFWEYTQARGSAHLPIG